MENIEEARKFFSNDKFATEVTGITIDEVHDGFSRCSLEITEKHLGAHGQIMGGVIFTLADFAFAAATNSKEHFTATIESKINFISASRGKKLFAECRRRKDGRTLCFYETVIFDDLEKTVATVSATGIHIERA